MNHRVAGRHLKRATGERLALYRNLIVSLVQHEKMKTTEAKAKEVRARVEKLITLSREDNEHNRRLALSAIPNELAVKKLFEVLGPRYAGRRGGYTRMFKLGQRRGDAAPIVQIELVEE